MFALKSQMRWFQASFIKSTRTRITSGPSTWVLPTWATSNTCSKWANCSSKRRSLTRPSKSTTVSRSRAKTLTPKLTRPSKRSRNCKSKPKRFSKRAIITKRQILPWPAMSTSNFRAWMARRNSWRAWTSIAAEDALCAVKASKMLLLISILAIGGQMLTALLIPHLLFGQISAKATLSDAVVVLAFSCSPFYCSFSDLLQSFCFLTNKTNSRSTTTVVKSRFCKIQSSSPTRSLAHLIQIQMIATAHRSWKISAPLSEILRSLMVRQSLAKSGLRTTRSHRQLVLSSLCRSLWSTVYFVSLCRRLRLSKDITLSLSDWRPPSQKCGLFSLSTRPSSLLLSTISFRRMA